MADSIRTSITLPKDLHAKLKSDAALCGESFQDYVVKLIKVCVKLAKRSA